MVEIKNRYLAALLANAAKHHMTDEDIEAQRKSWAIGELMLGDRALTREEAECIYNGIAQ